MIRNILSLSFTLFFINVLAQKEDYTLSLKDTHSSQISHLITTKDLNTIISADKSGKIIAWDANTLNYLKTIKKPNNIPIDGLRLIMDDKSLLYTSNDSIWGVDSNGKVLTQQLFNGKIVSHKNSNHIILTKQEQPFKTDVAVFNSNFKGVTNFIANHSLTVTTVTQDSKFIAYIEEDYKQNQQLVYRNLQDNTVVWKTPIDAPYKIAHLFFDKNGLKLFAITIDEKDKKLAVVEYTNGKKSNEKISYNYNALRSQTKFSDNFIKDNLIVITTESIFNKPLVLYLKNNKFSIESIKTTEGAITSVYLPNKKELVLANLYSVNLNDISALTLYNWAEKSITGSYPNFSKEFYSGVFLPDDSWIAFGKKFGKPYQVKYYEKGTFNNRFHTLNLSDYIEANHKIYNSFREFNFYKDNSNIVFVGQDLNTTQQHIYKYNLPKDEIIKIYDFNNNFSTIIDYNNTTNNLLLSPIKYYNKGHIEPQPLTLVSNNKPTEILGNYKFAKFSKNGKQILTINKNNLAQIRNLDLEVIFKKQLINGFYNVMAVENNDFLVSNSYQTIDLNSCNAKSLGFIYQPNNTYKTQEQNCVYITNIASKNNQTAMIIDGFGIVVNNKTIELPIYEMPKNISFNADASKLMVSYANGKIGVLDTKTLKEVGGSFHPSIKEHIFYDAKNHYFSNTDANSFLGVKHNKTIISLEKADPVIFKPNEVLKVFGEPNQDYLKLLNKAIALRQDKTNYSAISIKQNNAKTTSKKGDLYVLSIGVSNYKQSNYNLTFADKDAFDIANLYGELDQKTIADFNTKFLGEKYSLKTATGKKEGVFNKFLDAYTSIGDLYPIGNDGNIWLEFNDYKNEAQVWNYKKKTMQKITLPENTLFDGLENGFYESPDNKAFYILTEDEKLYQYSFKDLQRKEITIPFKVQEYEESIHPLENNRWSYFKPTSGLDNHLKLYFGTTNSSKIDSLKINTEFYTDVTDNEVKKASVFYLPSFKDISNNGKHLLFKASEKDLYLVRVDKDTIPTKLPISIDKFDQASISTDGKRITILKSASSKEYTHKAITYALDGKVINNTTLKDEGYNIKGISIANANVKYIEQSASLVDRVNYSFKIDKSLKNATPHSFNSVKVNYITNNDAKKDTLEKTLADFFSTAKPEDQILLFIAGHGVLDDKNNYYYAPYDMDFNNVTQNGLAFKTIVNALSNSKANQKLLLMDTCHSGNTLDLDTETTTSNTKEEGQRGAIAVSGNKQKTNFKLSTIVSSLFTDFLSTSGVTILSASSGGDVAFENKELGNGAFTTAYLKTLQQQLAGIGFINNEKLQQSIPLNDNFIDNVLKEVIQLTNGKQIPDVREQNKNVVIRVW